MNWKMLLEQLKENLKLVIGVGLVFILVAFFYLRPMTKDTDDALAVSSQSSIAAKTDQSTDKQTPDKQKSETSKDIMVDIKGAVKKPACPRPGRPAGLAGCLRPPRSVAAPRPGPGPHAGTDRARA